MMYKRKFFIFFTVFFLTSNFLNCMDMDRETKKIEHEQDKICVLCKRAKETNRIIDTEFNSYACKECLDDKSKKIDWLIWEITGMSCKAIREHTDKKSL